MEVHGGPFTCARGEGGEQATVLGPFEARGIRSLGLGERGCACVGRGGRPAALASFACLLDRPPAEKRGLSTIPAPHAVAGRSCPRLTWA